MKKLFRKYWDNFDKSDQNFLINAICIGFVALIILYALFYFIDENSEGKHTLFFIKSFGTIITVIGLSYAIHIQLKLKSITVLLNENKDKIEANIQNHYTIWNIQKALGLTNEVETALTYQKYETSIVLIRILQENLTECNKSFFNDYDKELMKCLKCLPLKDKRTLEEIINDCKKQCN